MILHEDLIGTRRCLLSTFGGSRLFCEIRIQSGGAYRFGFAVVKPDGEEEEAQTLAEALKLYNLSFQEAQTLDKNV